MFRQSPNAGQREGAGVRGEEDADEQVARAARDERGSHGREENGNLRRACVSIVDAKVDARRPLGTHEDEENVRAVDSHVCYDVEGYEGA
jgi:hypothetical protein